MNKKKEKSFYERLEALMQKNNENANQLALAIGIAPQGKSEPKVETIILICKHYAMPLTYFVPQVKSVL